MHNQNKRVWIRRYNEGAVLLDGFRICCHDRSIVLVTHDDLILASASAQ